MTGCERILSRLERGPATAAELYAETYSIVHSRIADLRKRGHVITCEHVQGETGASSYLYRLSSSGDTDPCGQPPPMEQTAASPPADAAGSPPPASSVSPVESEQLRLVA